MPRQRLGVALLVPGPAAAEIDGLRRALGDGALGRIPAHLTLVPPVNVPVERVPEALAVLRTAAAAAGAGGPLRLRLGPAATFHPVTPVVYLEVGGDVDRLAALRDGVFRPPLQRALTHAFVPHVTLADDMAPARIPAAVTALADACVDVTVDRVHLLREEAGRIWRPVADAPLAPAVVVGRGGLPLELTTSEHADPEAQRLLAWGESAGEPVAVAARRDGELVGVAHGWSVGPLTRLAELVVVEGARRQGVGSHLLAAFERVARDRGSGVLEAVAPDDPAATALLSGAGWRAAASPQAGWRWWTRPLT
jgi:2'-5' RNA ligase